MSVHIKSATETEKELYTDIRTPVSPGCFQQRIKDSRLCSGYLFYGGTSSEMGVPPEVRAVCEDRDGDVIRFEHGYFYQQDYVPIQILFESSPVDQRSIQVFGKIVQELEESISSGYLLAKDLRPSPEDITDEMEYYSSLPSLGIDNTVVRLHIMDIFWKGNDHDNLCIRESCDYELGRLGVPICINVVDGVCSDRILLQVLKKGLDWLDGQGDW